MFRLVSKIYFSGEISLNNKDNNFKVFVFKKCEKKNPDEGKFQLHRYCLCDAFCIFLREGGIN